MKKIKVSLGVVVFMLAIGTAWASMLTPGATVQGYRRITTPFRVSEPSECNPIKPCSTIGTMLCRASVGPVVVSLWGDHAGICQLEVFEIPDR